MTTRGLIPNVLSTEEVAQRLQVSTSRVKLLAKRKELLGLRLGSNNRGTWIFTEAAVTVYEAARGRRAPK